MTRTGRRPRVIPAWAGNTAPYSGQRAAAAGHPRMGGEHIGRPSAASSLNGSSPHGRGTHVAEVLRAQLRRVIPAWAGNTYRQPCNRHIAAGHPRMGGEHALVRGQVAQSAGSSPHGRGTLLHAAVQLARRRVIPAWAGNTVTRTSMPAASSGHPRMGGEHTDQPCASSAHAGSSPHGRGTRHAPPPAHPRNRVIPAWAGNTPQQPLAAGTTPGHPRMGGEHRSTSSRMFSYNGSSPHGRGTHRRQVAEDGFDRVIPAWAGNTWCPSPVLLLLPGHPRMGGEHSITRRSVRFFTGSSPHGRGTRSFPGGCWATIRVIPAWAGNTHDRDVFLHDAPGHPRMGGEHLDRTYTLHIDSGSSPHGRGTLIRPSRCGVSRRVIPAWAGNTWRPWRTAGSPPGHPRMGGEHETVIEAAQARVGSSPHGRGTLFS